MKKKYSFVCKSCWHSWSNYLKSDKDALLIKCVRCGGTDIDIDYDLMFEEA
jgi:DNA-directed RNA polymerase subunit RPC12/RpoP